jgi:hypothetical protein
LEKNIIIIIIILLIIIIITAKNKFGEAAWEKTELEVEPRAYYTLILEVPTLLSQHPDLTSHFHFKIFICEGLHVRLSGW